MIIRTAGALVVFGAVIAAAPANAGSFGAVVEKVLMSQQSGPVAKLNGDRKRQLVSCVNNVLAALPAGKKRYVTEASSLDEMQDRFRRGRDGEPGGVEAEDRPEVRQHRHGVIRHRRALLVKSSQ
jgi:hypothetical protein